MSHSETQPKKSSGWFFIGVLLLLFAAAVAVKILRDLNASAPAEDAARIEERSAARVELEAANKERLETYAWVDRETGSVQIPISVAMEMTVANLRGSQPTVAGPVDPAAAAPVETPADPAVGADATIAEAPASPEGEAATETPAPEPATSPANP